MRLLFLDFETYWDTKSGYTLSKIPVEEYVRHPGFHAFGCGLKLNDGPTVYVRHEQLPAIFSRIPWDDVALVCQNTPFDGFILSEIYDHRPKMYMDTASMYRFCYPNRSASLKNICESLGLPPKGHETTNTNGKRTLTEQEHQALGEYCKLDVELTKIVFDRLKGQVPLKEFRLIDITCRWAVTASLVLNREKLIAALEAERTKKAELLASIDATDKELKSSDKFAAVLRSLGFEPPIKISPAAIKKDKSVQDRADALRVDGKLDAVLLDEHEIPWTYAFSKTDKEFMYLLEHGEEHIQALCEARLGAKSTLAESRTERLIGVSERGMLPVPLIYWGAATGRWSAAGKVQLQNLPKEGTLREAIEAPPGHSIVVRDLAGIEARVLAFVAGQIDLIEIFKNDQDVYCDMATSIFQRTITKADALERQVGKTLVLGCGYGMGWKKIAERLPVRFTEADMDKFPDVSVEYFLSKKGNLLFTKNYKPSNIDHKDFAAHCAISSFLVNGYRDKCDRIEALWRDCDDALMDIHQGRERQVGAVPGLVTTCSEGLRFPCGRYVRYFGLTPKLEGHRMQWTRQTRNGAENIYGGLITENIIQALARHIIADQLLAIEDLGWRSTFSCHDELIFVVPDEQAEACMTDVARIMSTPPEWIKGVPLNSSGAIAKNYKEAK